MRPREIAKTPEQAQGRRKRALGLQKRQQEKRGFQQDERQQQQEKRGLQQDERQRKQKKRGLEQRNRERRQDRRESALDERDRLHELFVAVLGHDLRSPISTVKMSAASLLRDMGNPDKARLTIGRIQSSADRMLEMVTQLLDFTRTRLGSGFEIEMQRGEVVAFVQEACADFTVNHPERELIREFPESVEANFDRNRLRQAVMNLLSNAAAYAPPGTPIVTRVAQGPDSFSITVENQGPPIPTDVREALFNPFVRARKSRKSGGLGLGLYITQEIAKAHGGEASFTSDEGSTAFTLRLPRSL